MDTNQSPQPSPSRLSAGRLVRFWTRRRHQLQSPASPSPPPSAAPSPAGQLPHSRTTDAALHAATDAAASADPAVAAARRSSMPRLSNALSKCLSFRSRPANRKSPTSPSPAAASSDPPSPPPPPSPPLSDAPASSSSSSTTSGHMYCTSVSPSDSRTRANQWLTAWLARLPPDEATLHRARIAMNPMAWYRGALPREVAQRRLQGQPNGSWLVRDSQTPGCHFTLSFRSAGITLHYRIECRDGFWEMESYRNVSLVGLLEQAQQLSRDQILCYVRPSSQLQQPFPVRLLHVISKREEVPSLQHICRFVIRRQMSGEWADAAEADEAPGGKEGWDELAALLPATLCDYVRERAFLGRHIGYFET